MKIGVLSLQGAFVEHEAALAKLGVDAFEIRQKKDLEQPFDGLILPGGESTVMGKLSRELDMYDGIVKKIQGGMPVMGTCAGLLLLAKKIDNDQRQHFATMDIVAERNAYGRQLGSFSTQGNFEGVGNVPMRFIRAPYIKSVGKNVKVLAKVGDRIVAAREGNQLVTAFHPELTSCLDIHRYFINMVACRP